jgi:putative transposase
MVRYRRNFVPGGTFFFTVTLADRRSRMLTEHVAHLRMAFREARRQRPLTIDAIVILPEHLHAVMTLPANDTNFSARWQRIKGLFTRRVATGFPFVRDRRGEYGLWQKRFWEHTIRDDDDFARHIDYIHFNPVKHGLVSRVSSWRYSSFHRYVKSGLLPADWGGDVAISDGSFGERVT